MPSGLDPLPPGREPPDTTPHAEQSLLASSRRDLSAADDHKGGVGFDLNVPRLIFRDKGILPYSDSHVQKI